MTKTRFCEECKHSYYSTDELDLESDEDPPAYCYLLCRKGHKPRFYKPKSPVSVDWGYKRRCEDFEAAPSYHVFESVDDFLKWCKEKDQPL